MKVKLVAAIVLTTLMWNVTGFTQSSSPYLYFYSEQQQAFIIERADRTNSHILMRVSLTSSPRFSGPGWSPDGEWFAWQVRPAENGPTNAAVINIESGQTLESILAFNEVLRMDWSPDGQFLLVTGKTPACPSRDCQFNTYWLIDVQRDLVIATLDLAPGASSVIARLEWLTDNGGVIFYEIDSLAIGGVSAYTRVTLYADGRVVKEPLTYADWTNVTDPLPPSTPEPRLFGSPDGRYFIDAAANTITDTVDNTSTSIPTSEMSDNGLIVDVQWHSSEEWVLLNYELDDIRYATSVFETDGSTYRELATCGFGPACVGWLPENVDVSAIPQVSQTSSS